MKIFILCCLSLFFFAGEAADTNTDNDELEELLDAVLLKKSEIGDTAAADVDDDDDDLEEEELNVKMLRDILAGDNQDLALDLQTRMNNKAYNDYVGNTLGPRVASILKEATKNVANEVKNFIDNSAKKNFYCRLSSRNRPRWLRLLKGVFEGVNVHVRQQCKSK